MSPSDRVSVYECVRVCGRGRAWEDGPVCFLAFLFCWAQPLLMSPSCPSFQLPFPASLAIQAWS